MNTRHTFISVRPNSGLPATTPFFGGLWGKLRAATKPSPQAAPVRRSCALRFASGLLCFFIFTGVNSAYANASVTTATGGSAVSADTAAAGGTGAYTGLTGPVITETDDNGVSTGSLILTAPAGFAFDTTADSVTVTVSGSGTLAQINTSNTVTGQGTSKTVTPTSTTITIWVTTASPAGPGNRSTFTWSGIQVRPASGTPLASGNIVLSGTETRVPDGTNMGTLTEVAGAIDHFSVSAATPVRAGSTFSTTVTAQDQFDNTVTGDSATVVTMTGSGSAQFDSDGNGIFGDNTKTLSGGQCTISTQDTVAETMTLTATAGPTSGTSSSVVVAQSLSGDYRSKQSGAWGTAGNWETYNGSAWGTAASAPVLSAYVTILNGHAISSGAITLTGSLTVETGGALSLGSGNNLKNEGTIIISGGTVTCKDFDGTGTTRMSGGLLQVYHDFKPDTPANFSATGGTVEFPSTTTSAGGGAFDAVGTYHFFNVVVAAGVNPKFQSDGDANANVIAIAGSLTLNGGLAVPFPTGNGSTAGSLFFGAVQQAAGTWAGSGSSPVIVNATYFSGAGQITVTSGPAAGDFQSHQTGDWNSTATWERFDGMAWVYPAASTPSSADGFITIRSGHVVTVAADVAVDEAVVQSGGQVTVAAGVTLTLGNGNDLLVNSGGILIVHGLVVSGGALTVWSGETLGGNGTISNSVTVNSGGTVAPGASVGTLTVAGDVTFESGSTYTVEVGGGNAIDRLNVSGTLTLSNATLNVGELTTASTNYVIASSTTGIAGTFNGLTNNSALPAPNEDYYIHYVTNGTTDYIVLNSSPLSAAIDISAYATAGGVTIELWTTDESGHGDIVVFAWINEDWLEVGRVAGIDVAGEGSHCYYLAACGLATGASYAFKVVDEAGHVHYSAGPVTVQAIRLEAVRMDLQTMTLTFNTEVNHAYVVKVSTNLVEWTDEVASAPTADGWSLYTAAPFTASQAHTQLRVPVNGRARAYFKIARVN